MSSRFREICVRAKRSLEKLSGNFLGKLRRIKSKDFSVRSRTERGTHTPAGGRAHEFLYKKRGERAIRSTRYRRKRGERTGYAVIQYRHVVWCARNRASAGQHSGNRDQWLYAYSRTWWMGVAIQAREGRTEAREGDAGGTRC